MNIYHFAIHPHVPVETAWMELEMAGIEVLYSDEDLDGHNKTIVCQLPSQLNQAEWLTNLPSIQSIQLAPALSIDWEAQWSEHGLDFRDGFVHVRIGAMEFVLKPGPGFGDASHPSTRLVLELMASAINPKQAVLDVGCGSGILSIAAAKLGAHRIYAIDIDPAAIRHTIENITLNNIENPLWVGSALELLEQNPKKPLLALMNMISSEQELAWESLAALHPHIEACITSGILNEEKEAYLQRWQHRGWSVHKTLQEDDWIAFHLHKGSSQSKVG